MKIQYAVLIMFIFISAKISSQTDWVIKEPVTGNQGVPYGHNLLCDKDSNVYVYGSPYGKGIIPYDGNSAVTWSDTTGTFLQKFSPQGNLLMFKKWHGISFNIKNIIYDGSQYFYFTGFFTGSGTVDGISFTSKGKTDGMIGKMNSNGIIQWMKTFGSAKDEQGCGLCFGPSNNSLILTGSTTDSLIVNNIFVSKGQQSMLVAQFSLSGVLQNHKLWDFLPQRDLEYEGNFGWQIFPGSSGNYFVLADREGKRSPCCSSDTISAPYQGTYVMKLNSSFDTLWTKYIIGPGCYYGYNYGRLSVSANGDPYIPSFCSGKYGGYGQIDRLNPNNGSISWSRQYNDFYGGYRDIFLDGNTLFTCGTDSADVLPGPGAHNGYEVVRTFNQSNTMIDSSKFYQDPGNMELVNITRDKYGNTFVEGGFSGSTTYIVFGKDTIRGDATTNGATFLMKLSNNYPLAIKEINYKSSLNIYPNPSSGTFEISFSGKENGNTHFNVFNSIGKLVYAETISNLQNESKKTIDLGKEAKGLYLIEVYRDNEKMYKKVMLD